MSSYKQRYQTYKTQVDNEVGKQGLWGQFKSKMGFSLSDRRKAAIDKVTKQQEQIQKYGHVLDGKAQPARELSSGAKAVLPYVTGFIAQASKEGTDELSNDVAKRLALGTDAMQYARNKLNKGRGNVDADNPQFPEAQTRTHLAYNLGAQSPFKDSWAGKAAAAELVRAGNCDQHSAVATMFTAGQLDDKTIAAKVVYPGHTFSELRGETGHTQVSGRDVIVDSWAKGAHAVLREESNFADQLSASHNSSLKQGFTQATFDKASGSVAAQKRAQLVAGNQNEAKNADARAHQPSSQFKLWADTEIESDAGRKAMDKRAAIHQGASKFTQEIQKVHAARQMGANISGAVKSIRGS